MSEGTPNQYFQFPIAALRVDLDSGWQKIVFLAARNFGHKAVSFMQADQAVEISRDYASEHEVGLDSRRSKEILLLVGLAKLGVHCRGRSAASMSALADSLAAQIADSPFPEVRISSEIWWRVFGKHDWPIPHREFRFLAGVYAAIGGKPYARASLGMLQRFAAGYPRRGDPGAVELFTPKQARLTLEKLHGDGWFSRFTYNRGEVFFSNKLSPEKLAEAIAKRKTFAASRRVAQGELNQAVSDRILELRGKKNPPSPPAPPGAV